MKILHLSSFTYHYNTFVQQQTKKNNSQTNWIQNYQCNRTRKKNREKKTSRKPLNTMNVCCCSCCSFETFQFFCFQCLSWIEMYSMAVGQTYSLPWMLFYQSRDKHERKIILFLLLFCCCYCWELEPHDIIAMEIALSPNVLW